MTKVPVLLLAIAVCINAQQLHKARPKYLDGVGLDQNLNAQVPLQAQFRDEVGRSVTLGQYLGRRPAILALVYFTCPALCDQILHGVVAAMRPLSLRPGRDFDVIAISINPQEGPPQAAEKQMNVVNMYSPGASFLGWHFLTGNEQNIRAVADAVGFRYRYDTVTKMFFHPAGIMVLTPEGKAARYLYGVYFEPKDLKLSLIEASHNRIGSPVDRILLFCCRYNVTTGKYTFVVLNLLRVAAALMLVLLVCGIVVLSRGEVLGKKASREVNHL
jgi:protein SCO1/2